MDASDIIYYVVLSIPVVTVGCLFSFVVMKLARELPFRSRILIQSLLLSFAFTPTVIFSQKEGSRLLPAALAFFFNLDVDLDTAFFRGLLPILMGWPLIFWFLLFQNHRRDRSKRTNL